MGFFNSKLADFFYFADGIQFLIYKLIGIYKFVMCLEENSGFDTYFPKYRLSSPDKLLPYFHCNT
jgi:phospholipase C